MIGKYTMPCFLYTCVVMGEIVCSLRREGHIYSFLLERRVVILMVNFLLLELCHGSGGAGV